MSMEDYLDELKGQIRDKHAKVFVSEEVRGHMEDQAQEYEKNGMPHEEALSKAVTQMGDPVSVGVDLDRIHRPHMEWRFLLYVLFIAVLNIVTQYVINRNMSARTGAAFFENVSRVSIFHTVTGFAAMLGVYRLDYTILAGKSRMTGFAYLSFLTLLSCVCGESMNGLKGWIRIGTQNISFFALMVLFLPVFAGILYEYRGKGTAAVVKITLWMFAPVLIQLRVGALSLSSALFLVVAEALLFVIALKKDWYAVNKKAVIAGGLGSAMILSFLALIRSCHLYEYQSARLKSWLAHFGIGSYASHADSTINYINSRLSDTFAKCNLIGGSDAAVAVMKELPSCRSDLILGSVAASCGIIGMIGIIFCLFLLAMYVFHISLRQKNSLGCIVGCSCGVAIGLQSLCNILIVFGFLPLTASILPFFASGLSFMVVDYALLGLVLSIYRYKDIRREKSVFDLTLRGVE